ncbi:hypothetical protein ZWY2020_013266 [Hordeum vulgare]|nr:hypothetical protein ZWY2020_013266 [Hordeum vulgare]
MTLLRSEEPSCVKQEAALPKSSAGIEIIPKAVQDTNKAECTGETDLSDENAPFWYKFDMFQKDARVIVQFLRSVVRWLEQTGFEEKIDVRLLEEVRHVCSQFGERPARTEKTARLTLEDLYSMWQDGEKKLQVIISSLCSERASAEEDGGRNEVQSQADEADEWTGCSDSETDAESQTDEAEEWAGCSGNEAEWVKEEEAAAQKAARRKKGNKKPKNPHKGRFNK